MFHSIFPETFEKIPILRGIGSLSMEEIIHKLPFIKISIAELQYPHPVFEPTAPIPFKLSPGQEVIPPIPVYLVIDKIANISLSRGVWVVSPTVFHLVLYFPFIWVSVVVSDFELVLGEFNPLNLVEVQLCVLFDCGRVGTLRVVLICLVLVEFLLFCSQLCRLLQIFPFFLCSLC